MHDLPNPHPGLHPRPPSEPSPYLGRHVFITGVCGTVGAELLRQVLAAGAASVVGVDNNESELFYLQAHYSSDPRPRFYLGDVRDREAMKLRMQGADVVLHAAALKHVGLCEESPTQAVQTNVEGTQNVIDACIANDVERMIFTSSDKAVNPTNVMGTSKLMGERLTTAASQCHRNRRTIFASTRFGNVLGSRGSVIPLFQRQIEAGGPITLTDREMTRFIMTLTEAVSLVLDSVWRASGGEVFVTKMPVARIEDLAEVMRRRLDTGGRVEIKEIGSKPGEKMYEELMNDEEVRRTYELDRFFAVLPPFIDDDTRAGYAYVVGRDRPGHPYNSRHVAAMSANELETFLVERDLL